MRKLLTMMLVLIVIGPGAAIAEIWWEPNDDVMTGERRATIFISTGSKIMATTDGVVAVRIEDPTNLFVVYNPSESCAAVEATIYFKTDERPPHFGEATDPRGMDVWVNGIPAAEETRMVTEEWCNGVELLVQLRTSTYALNVDRFSLMGLARAYREAMRHVSGG